MDDETNNATAKIISLDEERVRRRNPDEEPDIIRVMRSEDDIGAVLRAHIYCEHELRVLLTRAGVAFRNDSKLSTLREQARKQGLITDHDASALAALNKLRNKFAHELNFSVDRQARETLTDSLRGMMEDAYTEFAAEEPSYDWQMTKEQKLLRCALYGIWFGIWAYSQR